MNKNARCSICNKVSSRDIETNLGDFMNKSFVPDPKNSQFYVCVDCKESHESLMLDYERANVGGVWGNKNYGEVEGYDVLLEPVEYTEEVDNETDEEE